LPLKDFLKDAKKFIEGTKPGGRTIGGVDAREAAIRHKENLEWHINNFHHTIKYGFSGIGLTSILFISFVFALYFHKVWQSQILFLCLSFLISLAVILYLMWFIYAILKKEGEVFSTKEVTHNVLTERVQTMDLIKDNISIFKKFWTFWSKYIFTTISVIIFLITIGFIVPLFGLRLNFRKMIYTFAQSKGVPLESTKKAVELYQVNIPGEDRKLAKDGNKATIKAGVKDKLYFGLKNVKENNASYKLPILEIRFPEESMGNKIIIENEDVKAQGWLQMEPSGRYVRERRGFLPPQITATVLSLFVKCEKGKYKVEYIISGYDEPPVGGEFTLVAE
jgi:hypothetical protein